MKNSDQECSGSFVLSSRLPYPAQKLVQEYLDIFALKALRLVCKTTKSWVETPELLRQFPVRITGKARLENLLLAAEPVPWNSFIFSITSGSEVDVQGFLAAYGDQVRELTFSWRWEHQWPQFQLRLLSGCPHLESLSSGELNFDLISNEVANQLLENWKTLRHFDVEAFSGSHNTDPGPMPFFLRLLSTCTNLETLRVPMFRKENSPNDFVYTHSLHHGDSYERHVATPLLDTIAKGSLQSVSQDYCDDEHLLRLALVCRNSGTVLRGVKYPFLQNLPSQHLSVLDIIGDLDTITDAIMGQSLTNVRSIFCTITSFRALQDRFYTMPAFAHLTSVEFHLRFWDPDVAEDRKSMEAMELFVYRLVKVKRPSVKRLRVGYDENPPAAFPTKVGPVDWCTSFVNLRVLILIGWVGRGDAEWLQLWKVGQYLVELELEHYSPNLSDRGILGNDLSQPAFLQLKHLRKLKLENWMSGKEKITELSFVYAFRHMRLQQFVFLQRRNLQPLSWNPRRFSAETKKAMWEGAFGETIEIFILQGWNMMAKRPAAKKSSGDQDGDLDYDNHPKLDCCSIT